MPARPAQAIVTALLHDTLVQLYLAVLVAEAVIYAVPLMDPGTLTAFGASPFEIPFVATVTFAAFVGLRRVPEGNERLYWTHLAWAMLFWLATLVWVAVIPPAQWTASHEVLVDASYLLFYSPILLAVERKPHLPRPSTPRETERQLRWAGVTLLVVGYFIYFVVAPVMVEPSLFQSELPSSLLFVTIDAAIIIRFAWRAWSCGSVRWRVLYGTMAAAGIALGATDMLDALGAVGVVHVPDGAVTDLLWTVPPFFFLVAFRLRELDLPRTSDGAGSAAPVDRSLDPVRVGAFLVGSALSFPVVHFALHGMLTFTPELLRVHRLVALAEMAALLGLATAAYRILAREGLAQERTRAAFEERLRQAHKLEAIARLAGVVAREVTPPLDVLTAITDQMLDALAIGDPLRDQAQRASGQVQRLTEFTRSLSAVSRRRRGRASRVDVAAAIPLTVRPGSYVRLVVRDSGRGIPHDVLPHLFEPFYSTKGEEGSEATPELALASIYATVTQYGGCVSVTSEPGEGSAFEILLPAV